MAILDRYVLRQVMWPSTVGLLLLLLLYSIFTSVRLMRSAALGHLPAADILTLILAHDLSGLEILLPTAFFGGVVVVMCNWHRRGEAYAAYGGGINPRRISRVLVRLILMVSVCVALLSIFVRPYAYQLRYEIKASISSLDSSFMRSRQFYSWDQGLVIKAQEVTDNTPNLREVFARRIADNRNIVLQSRAGQIDRPDEHGRQRLELIDGATYEIGSRSNPDRITQFARMVFWTQRPTIDPTSKRRARDTAALASSSDRKEVAEYQWRLSMPFIALFMLLIAVELSRLKPKQSPYPRYTFALVMYVLIFTSVNVVTSAVENSILPSIPGVFSVVLIVGCLYLVIRQRPSFSLSAPL